MFEDRYAQLNERIGKLREDIAYRTKEIKFLENLLVINPKRADDIKKAIEFNKTRLELNNIGIQGCLDDITTLKISELEQTCTELL
mgnify:CR=1 FL=1